MAVGWEQQPLTPEQRAYLDSEVNWGTTVASGLLAGLLAVAVIGVGPDWPWYRVGLALFAFVLAIVAGASGATVLPPGISRRARSALLHDAFTQAPLAVGIPSLVRNSLSWQTAVR